MPVGQGHSVHHHRTHHLLWRDPLCHPKHSVGSKPHGPLTFCRILRRLQIWTLPDPDRPDAFVALGWQPRPCSSQRPSDPVATLATRLLFQLRSSWEEKHEVLRAPLLPAAGVWLSLSRVALGAACCPYAGRPLPSLSWPQSVTPTTFWSSPAAPRFQGAFWQRFPDSPLCDSCSFPASLRVLLICPSRSPRSPRVSLLPRPSPGSLRS